MSTSDIATRPDGVRFAAHLASLGAELEKLGAVKTAPDGFRYIDESVVPVNKIGASVATAYRLAVEYGYANGLI